MFTRYNGNTVGTVLTHAKGQLLLSSSQSKRGTKSLRKRKMNCIHLKEINMLCFNPSTLTLISNQ